MGVKMENVSKALIMAAEVLIGVMIISIGVYLFNEMGSYSAETADQIEEAQLAQYNNQFLKYYGTESDENGKNETIRCSIHDIVGVANLARKTNLANGFEGVQEPSDSNDYIKIELMPVTGSRVKHLEVASESMLTNIIKENDIKYDSIPTSVGTNKIIANTIYFKVTDVGIGEFTGKVNYMRFEPYN